MFPVTSKIKKWSAACLAALVVLVTLAGTASAQTYP
jgi:hypothetical protein